MLTDLFTAYYCARANKRNTWAQVKFEQHLTDIEKDFIDDSFSCRVGKGTLYGIGRLERAMRESSADYTRESWVLKLDIAGYFMNINRQKLYDIVSSHPAVALCPLTPESFSSPPLHIPSFETSSACPPFSLERRKTLHYLLSQIIFNDPTRGCRIKGSRSDWDGLPHSKSLFWSPPGCGLPIGNLTSQLFSNIYLDKLDRKIYLQPVTHGAHSLGAVLKPTSRFPAKRTLSKYHRTLSESIPIEQDPFRRAAVLQSYRGYFSNTASYFPTCS